MKINLIDLKSLRNEEHYQFQTEFMGLVDRYTPDALGINVQYPNYMDLVATEAVSLNLIRKSPLTDELVDADAIRDATTEGLFGLVNAATKHFDGTVREAASRVQFVLDQYTGIAYKPYTEETAAIKSLLKELRDKHAADLTTLRADGWVAELERNNTAFEELVSDRYTESVAKPQLNMREKRQLVDDAYRAIAERINALMVVNGPDAHELFVYELNERILKYKLILAQRKGRNKKVEEEEAR